MDVISYALKLIYISKRVPWKEINGIHIDRVA